MCTIENFPTLKTKAFPFSAPNFNPVIVIYIIKYLSVVFTRGYKWEGMSGCALVLGLVMGVCNFSAGGAMCCVNLCEMEMREREGERKRQREKGACVAF